MRWRFLLASASLAALAACSGDTATVTAPTDVGGGGEDTGESDAGGEDVADPDTGGGDDTSTCDDPDNDGYGPGCALGEVDCIPNDPSSYPGAAEQCGDSLDNNCDGSVDEGCGCLEGAVELCYEGPEASRDVGACRSGFRSCADGVFGECELQRLPAGAEESLCDGRDEDCDGTVDEGLTNACGQCGPVPLEICGDNLDNDCNGVIDDAEAGCDCDDRTNQPCYSGPPATAGRGRCRGGVQDCVDGLWGVCNGEVLPSDEICDGIDNDCDGFVDEGLRNACGDCAPVEPDEICDDLDNDCDGTVDEGVRLTCGLCPGEVVEEECGDGFDNDCNGEIDEGCGCTTGTETCYPGPPALAGVGACRVGARECDASGEFWGDCEGFVLPTTEVCDGIDNDCDGVVDIGPDGCSVCGSDPETCDGVDNDCDGEIDEGLRNACGDCIIDVVPEEDGGPELCDGVDNDCDGLIDEELVNACGVCDDSCYVEEWTDADDWREGFLDGIDEDTLDEGLRLGRTRFTFPDLWVANASDQTVTRINTTEPPSVVGTYPVGVSPSRTAVDFNGDVWVANRAFGTQGTVTKIASEGCSGDDCVLFNVNIGANDQIPRGLAIDAEGFAWVGTYRDGRLWRLSPETGEVVETHETGLNIYGLAIDSEGIIWIATISGSGIGAWDTSTNRLLGNWAPPGCSAPYGIAVDGDGNVWFGNWTCNSMVMLDREQFDAGTIRFETYTNGSLSRGRGVAVDGEGFVYIAASGSNRLLKFDPRTDSWVWSVGTCSSPIGVGVASDGNIWTMCYSSNRAQRFSPDGTLLTELPTGRNPYSYSDMTGFQLRNFTAPRGIWTRTFECGYDICTFDELVWESIEPPGTIVTGRGRSSMDGETWSEWTEASTSSPADLRGLPDGRYLEVELQLSTSEDEVTPLVTDVEVFWQRP